MRRNAEARRRRVPRRRLAGERRSVPLAGARYSWRVRARRLLVLLPRDAPRHRGRRCRREEETPPPRGASPGCHSWGGPASSRPSRGLAATPSGRRRFILERPGCRARRSKSSRPPWLPSVHFVKVGANILPGYMRNSVSARGGSIPNEDIDERREPPPPPFEMPSSKSSNSSSSGHRCRLPEYLPIIVMGIWGF